MNAAESFHPIQDAIEAIFKDGHVPRLQVDARVADVPEPVRAKWGSRLVIDLDASWPMNLEWKHDGFEADLAFGGIVMRCRFPWHAVYVVLDRATGTGIVIDKHMPAAGLPPRPDEPDGVRRAKEIVGRDAWDAMGKIRSLWRLANDASTTEAERESARQRARELAAKHDIDLDRLVFSGSISVADGGGQRRVNPEAERRRASFRVVRGEKA